MKKKKKYEKVKFNEISRNVLKDRIAHYPWMKNKVD